MKRILKLAGVTLLGAIASMVMYGLLLAALRGIRSQFGGTEDVYMMASFAVVLPLGFLLGSGLTGYLSSPYLNSRLGFICVSPGLYPALFMLIVNVVMGYVDKTARPLPFPEKVYLYGVFLAWFLSSWTGVRLGSFFRERKNK